MIANNVKRKLVLDGGMDVGFTWEASDYEKLMKVIGELREDKVLNDGDLLVTNFFIKGEVNTDNI